jgi:hypothetical protein
LGAGAERSSCAPAMLEAICKACAGIVSHLTDQPAKYMAVGRGLVPPLILIADSGAESAAKARLALRNLAHGEPAIVDNIVVQGAAHLLRPSASASAVGLPSPRSTGSASPDARCVWPWPVSACGRVARYDTRSCLELASLQKGCSSSSVLRVERRTAAMAI